MIQNVSQIEKEFLIKSVLSNEQPVRFHGATTTGIGLITTIDRSMLSVTLLDTLDDSVFPVLERLTGYFDCNGHTYAFETIVRDAKNRQLRVDPPARLLKSLQRKFVRVKKPKNISVSIHLPNEDISLSYPVCPDYLGVERCQADTDYSGKKLSDIIGLFRTRLASLCNANTIVMFRTKKPNLFEEKLITETGKVLFIPSTSSELPKTDPYPEGRIITAQMEESFEDPNYFVEGSRFEKMLVEKNMQGISSEIWCPIIYYQYVVGYIYVSDTNRGSFGISMVDTLWDFSRILAYELKTTGYFNSEEKKTDAVHHRPALLDISPGGMLIDLAKGDIRTPVKIGSVFSTELTVGTKKITCSARVIRRYENGDTISYGTTFVNLSSEDMIHLYEGMYHSPFSENNILAYEKQCGTQR